MKILPVILLTAAVTVPLTWFAVRAWQGMDHTEARLADAERKVLYYQSAMHPWIKSDAPGTCTICGMALTPVYSGEGPAGEVAGDVIVLGEIGQQVLQVATAEARVEPLEMSLTVAGTIDDDQTRHRILSAWTEGRIDRLYVNYEGAEVTEGQPLADFYSPALLQAEREYRSLSGPLRDAAALRLRQMGLSAAQITAVTDKKGDSLSSQILSPAGGTVVKQSVYEGQYVKEGDPLFEIADFSTMWFVFRAYEQDLPWIRTGLEVRVTTPAVGDRVFTGKITFIDPNLDPATRSAGVRVELANPLEDGRRALLHRLYADGTVQVSTPAVLTVPETAVLRTGGPALVYVDLGGGGYERREVKTGRSGGGRMEIRSGLEAGDKVVTSGNLLLDGQAEINRSVATATSDTP